MKITQTSAKDTGSKIFCLTAIIGTFFIPIVATAQTSSANISKASHLLLVRADGKHFDIADQRGKVIFINFWATTCVPCLTEMPSINQLYTHFLNDTNVLVIAIDADDDFINSVAFMNKHNLSLPVYNSASQVPAAYFRGVLPTTLLINKKGELVKYYEGAMDYDSKDFINLVDSLRLQP